MEPDWISEYYGKLPEEPKKEEITPPPPAQAAVNKSIQKKKESTAPKMRKHTEQPTTSFAEIPKAQGLDPELKDRFDAIMKNRDEIEKSIDLIYLRMGINKKWINDYLNNPLNFSSDQWRYLERTRKEMYNKIWKFVGEEQRLIYEESQKKKKSHETKGKTLGARKNWIPMH